MKFAKSLLIGAGIILGANCANATMRLTQFENHSNISLNDTTQDGRSLVDLGFSGGLKLDKGSTVISSQDGDYRIILEDAERSGYHRPHWKYHVWLESKEHLPLLENNRMLYAVLFYDGEGQFSLSIDESGKLNITAGYDCKDILYPWAVGTIGRGNPYHKIKQTQTDSNHITYFDYDNFVSSPRVNLVDSDSYIQPYQTTGQVK